MMLSRIQLPMMRMNLDVAIVRFNLPLPITRFAAALNTEVLFNASRALYTHPIAFTSVFIRAWSGVFQSNARVFDFPRFECEYESVAKWKFSVIPGK